MQIMSIDHSQMRLGRKDVRQDHRTLLLSSYLQPHLPTPPASVDWTKKVAQPWGMDGNDALGDCTAAAAAHLIQCWTACAGDEYAMPETDVIAFYEDSCGYDPADPNTDEGGVEIDVLNYWRKTGCAGRKIGAYVSVSPTSKSHVKDGIWLFGGLYLGIALPASAQSQKVWDVPQGGAVGRGKPGSWGGHAVPVLSYGSRGLTCVTWGAAKPLTWGFLRTYCQEAYAIISSEWVSGQRPAPNGFDLAALQADLGAL